jgi:hypothetical protein
MRNAKTITLSLLKYLINLESFKANDINRVGVGLLLADNDDGMFEKNV